jgi:dethiobiotin synthetase
MLSQQHFNGLFITGTDTDVGKTYISTLLIRALRSHGVLVAPRKPVESGCRHSPDGSLLPADGMALLEAAGLDDLSIVTPFRFKAALSPPRAAALEGQELELASLVNASQVKDSFAIVEGAGGFLSPISEDGLNADLAMALQLPVIVITPDRLGCVNHCLLTCEAIERRGLSILAVILNRTGPDSALDNMDNAEEIRRLTPHPVVEVSYQADQQSLDDLASLISTRLA